MIRRAAGAFAIAWLLAVPGAAEAQCRIALALGLDVSASVDASEYRLQLDGLAAALTSPAVRDVILNGGGGVALAVYEWSGRDDQRVLQDWTEVTDAARLDRIASQLRSTRRISMDDSTALGTALLTGGELLARAPRCWQRVLDVSGDGKNNDGVEPEALDRAGALLGVTVNALVIGADDRSPQDLRSADIGELSSYFNAHVIRGPGAFVQVALGFVDYERAMTRKLVRELQPRAFSALDPQSLPRLD